MSFERFPLSFEAVSCRFLLVGTKDERDGASLLYMYYMYSRAYYMYEYWCIVCAYVRSDAGTCRGIALRDQAEGRQARRGHKGRGHGQPSRKAARAMRGWRGRRTQPFRGDVAPRR